MKFHFLTPIFYVNKIKKDDFIRGASYGFWICIVNKYKNDMGLLAHEFVHVKQFWLHGLLIHKLLYKFCMCYRFNCELKAYVKQWKVSHGDNLLETLFVKRLFLCYHLNYSMDYIAEKFKKIIAK